MSNENEGRRAVYRAVKSYLAAGGLTRDEIQKMIEAAVDEQIQRRFGKAMSDPAFVARVLQHRSAYSLQQEVSQGVRDAVQQAIEVRIKFMGEKPVPPPFP